MGWFSRIKEWATRDPIGRVEDDQLRPLVLNDGGTDGCWMARVTWQGRPVTIEIGGWYEPDSALFARARTLLAGFDRFAAEVGGFLVAEAGQAEWAVFADEIRSLVIRDVCLFWPRRPEDGMVYFDGPTEWRCWRCDIIGRRLTCLGFDR